MKEEKKKIFIGLAWPYVNGDLHIGHLAGYLLPADIYARFHRLRGHDVLMASGSDCHGTPITVEAEKRGLKPEEIIEEYHEKNVKLFEDLKLTFDIFTKTTTDNHKQVVQEVFIRALEKGYIFKDTTDQYYSEEEDRFLPDRYVEGECPNCGYGEARSDQCDNCGTLLEEGELINPVNKDTGNPVSLKETEHYFFDWSKLSDFLQEYVDNKKDSWRNWVYQETQGWLNKGLKPRAITRDLEWGIEIPNDRIPEDMQLEDFESKRIYVWFDAVIGYLSASIEWADGEEWKDFWYNDSSIHAYFMGKDNLLFHTLFWPGELHAYDENIHLPDLLPVNQFLNFEEDKLSKSRGTAIDSRYISEKYGIDPVRFYITSIMPEKNDSSFSWDDFAEKHNSVLIGTIGNFVNRTLKMAADLSNPNSDLIEDDVEKEVADYINKTKENITNCEFRSYSENIRDLADYGNKYLSEKEPWKVEDDKKKEEILTNALFIVSALSLIIKPLLVETADKLSAMINISFDNWPDKEINVIKETLSDIQIKDSEPLFEKIEPEDMEDKQ